MFNEKEVSLEERKEKVKSMRDQRKEKSSDDEFELLDLMPANDESQSYSKALANQVLALDLSRKSTYVQLGVGGATGWFTGYMVGKVGRACAAAVGGSLLLINMGTRAGYITVDWEKVDNDLKTAGEDIGQKMSEQQEDEETKRLIQKASIFVRKNLVTVGGFAAGFFLGMATT